MNAPRPADHFPASLPCLAVGIKLARMAETPSERAGLSATLQLAAIVADRGEKPCLRPMLSRQLLAVHLRHLARQLDAATAIYGRQS